MLNIKKRSASNSVGMKALIYGMEKIGKTSLILTTPNPLFISLEKGVVLDANSPDVDEIDNIETFEALQSLMDELISMAARAELKWDSVCIDSATAIEKLIIKHILSTEKVGATMDSAMGGYGKAYQYAAIMANEFILKCDVLAEQYGKNIIFTAHSFQSKFVDEDTSLEYTRTEILLYTPKNGKTSGIRDVFTQWASLIGNLRNVITYGDKGKMVDHSVRELVVAANPTVQAGNRYGLVDNILIPKPIASAESDSIYDGWNYIAQAIYSAKNLDFFKR